VLGSCEEEPAVWPRLFRVIAVFTDRFELLAVGTVSAMSVRIELDVLADEVPCWGFGYLTTVSDDGRPHIIALTPSVADASAPVLRFDAGGGRACRNAAQRSDVAVVFPPAAHSDGFSLVLDGSATVDGAFVDVAVTSALLHRPAP
jgi:hypothetical protein